MAFTVSNSFTAGNVIAAADINENFDDVEALLNGGLTTDNLSSSAGVTNAQLATSKYELCIPLTISSTAWAASTNADYLAAVSLPGVTADQTYTVTNVNYVITDSGTTSPTFKVVWAEVTGGAFDVQSTFVNTTAAGADGNTIEAGTWTVVTAASANVLSLAATKPRFLALQVVAKNTGALSTADDFITVTVKLTASLRS